MFNFILYSIIISSFIALGVIVLRKAPLLAQLSEEEMVILGRKKGIIQSVREIDYKQHWLNFIIHLEKWLRRTKIIFLKIENLLSRWINRLRRKSQIMTQKSREWIRQRELKRQKMQKALSKETEGEIPVKISREGKEPRLVGEEEDQIPISELKKPIKEEQKWINLIVENPKNITAYKFLGLLYWKQHNYSDAKASLEMAVKLGSKDKKVREVLEELKKSGIK